jgi:hypothetical protein
MMQYCYTIVALIVTLLSHCCYIVFTLLLHCCHTVVTLLLHCCYTVVTLPTWEGVAWALLGLSVTDTRNVEMARWTFTSASTGEREHSVSNGLAGERCHSGVTVVLQWCHNGVTVVAQWCDSGCTLLGEQSLFALRGERERFILLIGERSIACVSVE